LAFDIANSSASVLRLDGTVAGGDTFTFLGTAGTLRLTGATVTGGLLGGFGGTVAGRNASSTP
jgi:hypothetical protein